MTVAVKRLAPQLTPMPIRWPLLAALALVITYADGFWMTALQGTIGAIERVEPPLMRWVRDSTIMLPLVILALVVGLSAAQHLVARGRGALARFGTLTLLVALLGAATGMVEATISALHDYRIQARHIEQVHPYSLDQQLGFTVSIDTAQASTPYQFYCSLRGVSARDAVSLLQYATFVTHVRALGFFFALILVTNLVLATLLLVVLPDSLWAERPRHL